MLQNPVEKVKRNLASKPTNFITANISERQILPARRLRPTLEELKQAGAKESVDGTSD